MGRQQIDILPLAYSHARSGLGSLVGFSGSSLSIFSRRVMSFVKSQAILWKVELPVFCATHCIPALEQMDRYDRGPVGN